MAEFRHLSFLCKILNSIGRLYIDNLKTFVERYMVKGKTTKSLADLKNSKVTDLQRAIQNLQKSNTVEIKRAFQNDS